MKAERQGECMRNSLLMRLESPMISTNLLDMMDVIASEIKSSGKEHKSQEGRKMIDISGPISFWKAFTF
jgi:hypothetical protein